MTATSMSRDSELSFLPLNRPRRPSSVTLLSSAGPSARWRTRRDPACGPRAAVPTRLPSSNLHWHKWLPHGGRTRPNRASGLGRIVIQDSSPQVTGSSRAKSIVTGQHHQRPDADARSARYKRVAELKGVSLGASRHGIGDLCGQVRAPACFLADDRGHLDQPEDQCSCPFPGLTDGRPGAVVSCGNRNLSCLGCRDARREGV